MNKELNPSNPTFLLTLVGERTIETSDDPSSTTGGTKWSRLVRRGMPVLPWLLGAVAGLLLLWGAVAMLGSRVRSVQEGATEISAAVQDSARAVESAGQVLSSVFGGQVSINNQGVVLMPQEIAELAVLEHDAKITSRYSRTCSFGWYPSSLVISGYYRGLLGIDVEKVSGHFDPETLVLEVELPSAKILAVESLGLEQVHQSDWWINRVGSEEAVQLAGHNLEAARQQLNRRELLQQADRSLRRRLSEACTSAGVTLRIREGEDSEG